MSRKKAKQSTMVKNWVYGLVIALFWLGHLVAATWFVTHCEVIEGRVVERHKHLLPSKRHGWECIKVIHTDQAGKQATTTIKYNASDAPKTDVIPLWQASSGLISVGAASFAEAFWFEIWAFYLFLYLMILVVAVKATPRVKKWLEERR
jgi:hypothetical protein